MRYNRFLIFLKLLRVDILLFANPVTHDKFLVRPLRTLIRYKERLMPNYLSYNFSGIPILVDSVRLCLVWQNAREKNKRKENKSQKIIFICYFKFISLILIH